MSSALEIVVWLKRSSSDAMHNVQIKVPATIMYATGKEGCGVRKPEPGMWDFFVEHLNDGVQPGVYHCLSAAELMRPMPCRQQLLPACEPCTSRWSWRRPPHILMGDDSPQSSALASADKQDCFFVGDAGGRYGDFADSDKCALLPFEHV